MLAFLKIEVKSNLLKIYLSCFLLVIFGFVILGTSNLTHAKVIQFEELIFNIVGLIAFNSLVNIDNNTVYVSVIDSKEYDYKFVFINRILLTIVYTLLLILSSLLIFIFGHSEVNFMQDFFVSHTSSLFLGSICMFVSQVTQSAINGFMVGMSYFLVCLGFRNLGILYLFPETFNYPSYIKVIQFIIAICLLSFVIILKNRNN